MTEQPIKRNRYFDDSCEGTVNARNLEADLENFHLLSSQAQLASLHNWGIAQGLEVNGTLGSNIITINTGVALDAQGNLIVLASEGRGDLGSNPPGEDHDPVPVPVEFNTSSLAEDSYYLTIQFSEILRFDDGGAGCGRLEQAPWLRLQPVSGFTDDGTAVVLAIVTVDSSGNIAALAHQDSNVARHLIGKTVGQLQIARSQTASDKISETSAGKLEALASGGLQLSVTNPGDQILLNQLNGGNFSSLTVQTDTFTAPGKVGIGTTTPIAKLEVTGDLKLEAGVAINEFSSDGSFSSNSELAVPTQRAVKTYVDGRIDQVNAAKAALNGSATEDFQTRNLTVNGNLTATSGAVIADQVSSSRLEISILDQSALQLFAPEQKNTYLTLLNPNVQQAIQLDTTTGAGSIRIKNSQDKGIGAFQASDDGAGLLRLYDKTGEHATIELFADLGESGVIKLFGADGSEKLQLSEGGISTSGAVIANNILSRGSVSSSSISASSISSFTSSGIAINNGNNFYGGTLTLNKSDGNVAGWFWVPDGNRGKITLLGADGNQNINIEGNGSIFARSIFANQFGTINTNAWITKTFADNKPAVQVALVSGNSAGWLGLFDSNGNRNTTLIGDGRILTKRVTVGTTIFDQGFIETRSQGNKPLVRISTSSNTNHGWLGLFDSNGNRNVTLVGDGGIFGKTKNFIIDHPFDKTKNIIYAAIEGPEAAAYIRGKSELIDGQAEIEFPEHFSLVVNPDTITIQLTPRSAESKGLAVVSHSERGFCVRELWQGEGNYEFDYFVAGVRQGMENFTPVVDKGLTAFGEPMDISFAENTEAPQIASIMQEIVPSEATQPVESESSPEPQASSANEPSSTPIIEPQTVISEGATLEMPLPSITSIPSPPAIDFIDKQP